MCSCSLYRSWFGMDAFFPQGKTPLRRPANRLPVTAGDPSGRGQFAEWHEGVPHTLCTGRNVVDLDGGTGGLIDAVKRFATTRVAGAGRTPRPGTVPPACFAFLSQLGASPMRVYYLAEDLTARFPILTVSGWLSAEGTIPGIRAVSFRGSGQVCDVAFDGACFSVLAPGGRGYRIAACFYRRSPEAVLAVAEHHGEDGLGGFATQAPRHADWRRGDDGHSDGFFRRHRSITGCVSEHGGRPRFNAPAVHI